MRITTIRISAIRRALRRARRRALSRAIPRAALRARPSATASIAALAAALAGALAIAGCGSTTTKTVTVTPTTAATTATGAGTPTTATGAGATTTATGTQSTTTKTNATASTAAVTPPLCRAGNLALTFLGQQGALGHGVIGFALRNTGSASCHTFGYPGILWLSKSGTPLPTTPIRTTRDFFGPAPLASLTVAPDGTVSFRLGVTHMSTGGGTAGCTTAAALQVIPPNDTSTLRVTIPNGAFECRTTTVTPLRPGKSAFQI
jgi:hypothetical protein